MNIYEKLMNIQSVLKVPKGQYNAFGKYNYRNCEDILEGLKPLLAEQKCVLVLTDDVVKIDSRFYVKATAALIDAEGENSRIENTAFAREEECKKGMDGSQVTGASSSYARKYALNGLFGIDDTKDSDTTNTGGGQANNGTGERKKTVKITGKQVEELKQLAEQTGTDIAQMCQAYKVNKIGDMTESQYKNCLGVLQKKMR